MGSGGEARRAIVDRQPRVEGDGARGGSARGWQVEIADGDWFTAVRTLTARPQQLAENAALWAAQLAQVAGLAGGALVDLDSHRQLLGQRRRRLGGLLVTQAKGLLSARGRAKAGVTALGQEFIAADLAGLGSHSCRLIHNAMYNTTGIWTRDVLLSARHSEARFDV